MLGDSFLTEQRLLVAAPHADDEAIGCVGTIAGEGARRSGLRHDRVGGRDHPVRPGSRGQGREFVSGEQRMAEFEDVMSYLKVDGHEVLLGDDASHERLDAEVASADLVILLQDHSAYDLDPDTRGRTEGAHIEVL
jgi:hypothetical protein